MLLTVKVNRALGEVHNATGISEGTSSLVHKGGLLEGGDSEIRSGGEGAGVPQREEPGVWSPGLRHEGLLGTAHSP